MTTILASDHLSSIGGISPEDASSYASAGVITVRDLLERYPKRYEDRRRFNSFPVQAGGDSLCLRGVVLDARVRGVRGRRQYFEAIIVEASNGAFFSNKITCRWFNMPWMKNVLAAGHELILYGKPKDFKGTIIMDHPDFEIEDDGSKESIHLERIVPIYKGISGIQQRKQRENIHFLLEGIDDKSFQALYDIDPSYPKNEAIQEIHFPESLEQAEAAQRYFALEEFFMIQLQVLWNRAQIKEHQGRVLGLKTKLLTQFYHSLPFDLTEAQKRSVKEIIADMRSPAPMGRLLQGDVGSGKTFVAMCAMLLAVESGVQAALMAPTQILAEQHYLTFKQWLDPLDIRISLKTGSKEDETHVDESAQMIIGTHALLYGEDRFDELGLIVIDEQHKFGVSQRAKLIKQGVLPDVLVMTATPIPRTLTLTLYGDLDVSILNERPAGRGEVITALRKNPKVTDITKFLKTHLSKGRQAYLVYPLVEESDSLKAQAATVEFKKWVKRLSGYKLGLLHGKLPADEKESIMQSFRDGKLDVLVATTVIEVGVDVPNANIMVIHHAERYGLAQLHQLRGRIGRGEHKSYCILQTDGKSETSMEKLEVMEQTSDGFKIAEADLKIRGPGDVLGTAQSGLREIKFIDYLADTELIRQARDIAESLLKKDPNLTAYPQLLSLFKGIRVND